MSTSPHLIYGVLADWYHLFTAPAEYVEEEEIYSGAIIGASVEAPRTILDIGSGGGNLAFHYKRRFEECVLTDLSSEMLNLSKTINPELEHIQGDMRALRLGRRFDAVLIHDAINYMTTEADLREAMETAFIHTRPGGVALFAPDSTRETFKPQTEHGGNDGDGRAVRYLEWTWDDDPTDSVYSTEFVLVLHEDGKLTRTVVDHHVAGIFSRLDWLAWLKAAGFEPTVHPLAHSEVEPGTVEFFVGVRPAG